MLRVTFLTVLLVTATLSEKVHWDQPDKHTDHHHKQINLDDGIGDDDFFDAIAEDREHLLEHMEEFTDSMKSGMTTEEEKFHFFRVHDTDDSGGLDGQELLKALLHVNPVHVFPAVAEHAPPGMHQQAQQVRQHNLRLMEAVTHIVDSTLTKHDWSQDGYIDYLEFTSGAVNMFHPSQSTLTTH